MNKQVLFIAFMLLSKITIAQVSVGYFPFQSEVSISTNSEVLLWGDFRFATNTFYANITTEPVLQVNITRKEMVNIYAGIGMNFNFFNLANNISILNGYSLHIGSRIKPIRKTRNFQLIFEISPYLNKEFDGGLLRSRMGLAYQFKKRKSP